MLENLTIDLQFRGSSITVHCDATVLMPLYTKLEVQDVLWLLVLERVVRGGARAVFEVCNFSNHSRHHCSRLFGTIQLTPSSS